MGGRAWKTEGTKKGKNPHFALATHPPFVISYAYNERMVLPDGMGNGCFPVIDKILNV